MAAGPLSRGATREPRGGPTSLRGRILGAFLLSITFFLVAIGTTLVQLDSVGQALDLIDQGYVPLSRTAGQLEGAVYRIEGDLERIHRDEPRRPAGLRSNAALYNGLIDAYVEEGQDIVARVRPLAEDTVDAAHLEGIDLQLRTVAELNRTYREALDSYLDSVEAGELAEAKAQQPELFRAKDALKTEIDQLASRVDARVRRLSEDSAATQDFALVASGTMSLGALGLGLALLLLAVVSLRPIGRMTREVRRIAGGDYDARVEVVRRDELGVLGEQINEMARAIQLRDEDLRQRTEAELKNRDRLARTERLALVGQMLAQITHEVRNPLNAMSLNAELLAEDLDELPEARRQEALEILATLTSEIERLEQTTEHYLALARRPSPRLSHTDTAELVASVARLMEEQLRRAGVELVQDVQAPEPAELDANQLRRVLLNVVRNAVEAGASTVRVLARQDPEGLRIVVEDDGPGLDTADSERLFDPFYSNRATGTGLGLAITRQVLEDHGGTARFEPCERGCRLVLFIPR